MLTIDLAGNPIEGHDIDQAAESLSLKDLFVTADLKGFERLMKVFDGFVSVPQSSAGTIFASGVYMETGGWLVLQTSHDSPPGIQLHTTGGLDAGAVVAEFVNY